VTDHGSGIPEADRKHAVERFVRLEASRTQPGSGLGLSLASAVATLHGGELRLADAHPGLTAILAIPATAVTGDRLAAQTPDVPQKVA
jgi:signal transduction histidine kinase